MGDETGISWADGTFNPLIGCAKVSPACTNCYAEGYARDRLGKPELWRGERWVTSPDRWRGIARMARKAVKENRRQRLFVASLADVFEEHPAWNLTLQAHADGRRASALPGGVSAKPRGPYPRLRDKTPVEGLSVRHGALRLLEEVEGVDVLLLTKRPGNVLRMVPGHWIRDWPAHVWIGTTVESGEHTDRLDELVKIPARVRFVSAEPLLGELDLGHWLESRAEPVPEGCPGGCRKGDYTVLIDGYEEGCGGILTGCGKCGTPAAKGSHRPRIHWVITGGETGSRARPTRTDYYRQIRDACARFGVAYHHKQNGEWIGLDQITVDGVAVDSIPRASLSTHAFLPVHLSETYPTSQRIRPSVGETVVRLGASRTGHLLDGREHREFPFPFPF